MQCKSLSFLVTIPQAPEEGELYLAGLDLGKYYYGLVHPNDTLEARRIHHDSFLRVGYIDEPSPTGCIEDEFVEASIYFGVWNKETGEMVGVMRLIPATCAPLPALHNFDSEHPMAVALRAVPPKEVVEISSLALKPGHPVSEGLYAAIWQYSKMVGHTHWVASIDSRLLRIHKIRGIPWQVMGEEKFYMGSMTTPVFLVVDDAESVYKGICSGNWPS